jgi:methylmalonyl-CoA mutase, N-terminal domain
MWATLMRERFGANDASCKLRFHTQTGGVTLMAQQPLNNVVRVAVQTLAATLGGTQSLHTNGYDEALALPTAAAATLALRTQQIVAYESGVAQTVDPLGGELLRGIAHRRVERRGAGLARARSRTGRRGAGHCRAVLPGGDRQRSAYEFQLSVEAAWTSSSASTSSPTARNRRSFRRRTIPRWSRAARAAGGGEGRARRGAVARTLAALRAAAPAYAAPGAARTPLMPLIIDAVRARATVGEISDVFRDCWGEYRPGGAAARRHLRRRRELAVEPLLSSQGLLRRSQGRVPPRE